MASAQIREAFQIFLLLIHLVRVRVVSEHLGVVTPKAVNCVSVLHHWEASHRGGQRMHFTKYYAVMLSHGRINAFTHGF